MVLKIVDGAECKAEQIVSVIYGFPNSGKSTLSLTAKNPLLLDFDGGVHRAGNKRDKAIVRVESWDDVDNISMEDLKPYDTVIMDTVGTCLNYLSMDITRKNPKMGKGLSLHIQGYGELKVRFIGFLNELRMAGKDVVLIAHVKEERKGEETVDRIIAPGASRDEVYQSADIMGKLLIEDGKRFIDFDPSSQAYGKNVGLPVIELPAPGTGNDDAMEKIISKAKILINDIVDAGKIEEKRVDELSNWITGLSGNADDFNSYLDKLNESNARTSDKHMFIAQAKKNGVIFNRDTKQFKDKAEADPLA